MSYNRDIGMYEGYIYGIYDQNNKIIYVGQTTETIMKRWARHTYEVKHYHEQEWNMHIHNYMLRNGFENFSPKLICKFEELTRDVLKEKLNDAEIYYISYYNTRVFDGGCNVDSGGVSDNHNGLLIDCYDISGKYLATYNSQREASEKLGVGSVSIWKICTGQRGNWRNKYVFRYHGQNLDQYNYKTHDYREYYIFSKNGKFLKEAFSSKECMEFTGVRLRKSDVDNPNRLSGGYWIGSKKEFGFQGHVLSHPVDLYDINGNFIKSFKSITDCYNNINITKETIANCCNGITCNIKGKYVTRFSGDSFDKYNTKTKKPYWSKKVNQYTTDGIFIKTFDTICDAGENMQCNRSNISACCRGLQKTAKGYQWFYADDPSQPDKSKIMSKDE